MAPSLFRTFEAPVAGLAIGPMFPLYFALQGVCGLVALVTAWGWNRTYPGRVQSIRLLVIAFAAALVAAGWPLVGKVESLRFERYSPDQTVKAAAQSAFALWHTVSLLLNLAALALVGVATALMARLPADPPPAKAD